MKIFTFILISLLSLNAEAWGRRGHEIIATTAAYVLADTNPKEHGFFKEYSFDLAYYSNVPDIIWKRSLTYEIERNEHFLDLEYFWRANGSNEKEKKDPIWYENRQEFFSHYKVVKTAGRAPWRIQELSNQLEKVAEELRALTSLEKSEEDKLKNKEKRNTLQLSWLTLAGLIGHYVGDLSQPLHCTENYDGQMTNQKGLHAFYEEKVVNELSPEIEKEILRRAKKHYKFMKSIVYVREPTSFERAITLGKNSFEQVDELLKLDVKSKRNLNKAVKYMKKITIERMAIGSAYLALIWEAHTGWSFDSNKFYDFNEVPAYIQPQAE